MAIERDDELDDHMHQEFLDSMSESECDHEWAYTGTAYGGDDESHHGEGRCYCLKCGADGDA